MVRIQMKIKLAIFLFSILLLTPPAEAQQKWLLKKADKLYNDLQYAAAIPAYTDVLKKDKTNIEALTRLANCYQKINNSAKAEETFRLLTEGGNAQPSILLPYAQMLAQNGKYQESQSRFEQYAQQNTVDSRGKNHHQALSNLSDFFRDSTDVEVHFLEINTEYEDFSPAFYKSGFVFSSGRPTWSPKKIIFGWNNKSFLDLYFSGNSKWMEAKSFRPRLSTGGADQKVDAAVADAGVTKMAGDVNSVYHEGPMIFYNSGDSVIFTRNNFHDKKYKTDKSGVNRLKLYTAKMIGGQWTNIKSLSINNDEYSVGHPALSRDEKTLYFVSDMPGGKGETDVWSVTVENGTYGAPKNLGEAVNTEGREMFPYVDYEGNLFFASDGHGGLGGLDIFFAKKDDEGSFRKPLNVGYPINSRKDDFGLIVNEDGRTGYFSTYRNGDKTGDDIYSFSSLKPIAKSYSMSGLVVELLSKEIVPGTTVIISDENGAEIKRATTRSTASFTFPVEAGKSYSLFTEQDGYISNSIKVSTVGIVPGQPMKVELPLEKKGAYGLYCLVTDKKTAAPLDSVHTVITDMKTGSKIFDVSTPETGDFKYALAEIKKGDGVNFAIKLERRGYLSKTVTFNYLFTDPIEVPIHKSMDVSLEKVDVGADIGKILQVKPIYFDLGKSIIRKDAMVELDKIVKVMTENPGMKIELGSHTDSRGSDASNLALSDKRAKASAAYIVTKGIEAGRITGKGYGEAKLANKCGNGVTCSEPEHQLNRRTEFIILSLGN